MAGCFDAGLIGGMSVPNRFVRSATWEGLAAEDGSVTPELTGKMVELARGGVGLIITGYAFVGRVPIAPSAGEKDGTPTRPTTVKPPGSSSRRSRSRCCWSVAFGRTRSRRR